MAANQDIRHEIERLIALDPAGPTKFAVAFWGSGGERLPTGASLIVCDLYSGACNPDVIAALRARPSCRVRYLDGLHAKVVLNRAGAVVSSGNMSHNGLGHEGIADSGTLEAGMRVDAGTATHADVSAWFDNVWKRSRPVMESDLQRARQLFDARAELVAGHRVEPGVLALPLAPIASQKLLMNDSRPLYRVLPVTPEVLGIASRAVPGMARPRLGIVATLACHAILCRAGTAGLAYFPNGDDPGGTVTEAWIGRRFGKYGPDTMGHVDAVLLEISGELGLHPAIGRAAAEVLTYPAWD